MKPCRSCGREVDEFQKFCAECGAKKPASDEHPYFGFEYKSKANIFGLPLVHVSFRYNAIEGRGNAFGNLPGMPVPARGVIAIGQVAAGIVSIGQFTVGVFSLSQFTIAGFAIAQIGAAYDLIAQVGVYLNNGWGQVVWKLTGL